MLGIARVWDSINDQVIGTVIDRHQFKNGEKFRPLLRATPIFIGIIIVMLFTDWGFQGDLPKASKWVCEGVLIFALAYSNSIDVYCMCEVAMILYHGSENIIETPFWGGGKKNNDYGQGFYCTREIEQAREWACTECVSAYVNKYELDMTDLRVLDLSMEEIQRLYPALHEASEDKFVEVANHIIETNTKTTKLQMLRKNSGYSQSELAERSGVNKRMIQQYEIGAKDINKAAGTTLLALARVMGCEVEDLLEI